MSEATHGPTSVETADVSDALRQCWANPTPSAVSAFNSRWPVPGSPALRSRFETLADLQTSGVVTEALAISAEQWQEQIVLATAGDEALHRHDVAAAAAAFDALATSHRIGQHPLPLIEAETGRGDVARQAGDAGKAQRHYAEALTIARGVGARYAEIRAGTALGYIQLREVGVTSARESFRRAEQVALHGGWRLERANAVIGLVSATAGNVVSSRLIDTSLRRSKSSTALGLARGSSMPSPVSVTRAGWPRGGTTPTVGSLRR